MLVYVLMHCDTILIRKYVLGCQQSIINVTCMCLCICLCVCVCVYVCVSMVVLVCNRVGIYACVCPHAL